MLRIGSERPLAVRSAPQHRPDQSVRAGGGVPGADWLRVDGQSPTLRPFVSAPDGNIYDRRPLPAWRRADDRSGRNMPYLHTTQTCNCQNILNTSE